MTSQNVTQVGLEVWTAAAASSQEVVTQVGMEVWGAVTSLEVVTQAGMEVWGSPDTTSLVRVTQVGIEVWAQNGQLFFNSSGLWQSDPIPNTNTAYVEGNSIMLWEYETVLLPDNESMRENTVIETNLDMAFIGNGPVVSIVFADTNDNVIQAYSLQPAGVNTLWDAFTWDNAPWDGTAQGYSPYQIAWSQPLVFKQGTFSATGVCQVGFRIGTLFMNFQVQGYQQQTPTGVT